MRLPYYGISFAALCLLLMLWGCKEQPVNQLTPPVKLLDHRVVATLYKVATLEAQGAPCFNAPSDTAQLVVNLPDKQLVDLVAVQEGTLKQHNQYWLRIKPRVTSNKTRVESCFIQVNYLIPIG